jgi:hypothetical protein
MLYNCVTHYKVFMLQYEEFEDSKDVIRIR